MKDAVNDHFFLFAFCQVISLSEVFGSGFADLSEINKRTEQHFTFTQEENKQRLSSK